MIGHLRLCEAICKGLAIGEITKFILEVADSVFEAELESCAVDVVHDGVAFRVGWSLPCSWRKAAVGVRVGVFGGSAGLF